MSEKEKATLQTKHKGNAQGYVGQLDDSDDDDVDDTNNKGEEVSMDNEAVLETDEGSATDNVNDSDYTAVSGSVCDLQNNEDDIEAVDDLHGGSTTIEEDQMSRLCRLLAESFHDEEEAILEDTPAKNESIQDEESVLTDKVSVALEKSSLCNKPRPRMYVRYILRDGFTNKAKILSRQPKRGGKYGNWINVQRDGDDGPVSVNWEDVATWEELSEPEKIVLLTIEEEMKQEIVDAKEKKIKNLLDNDVFEVVEHTDQQLVSCKWVFSEKMKNGEKVVKARLVVRGFEEKINNARTDSPTCTRQALRLTFVTAPSMGWELHSLDITSAFLQGNGIERDVYLKPPPERSEDGIVWKLKRCIYGLKDAPRSWYERVEQELLRLKGKVSIYDEALFLWHTDDCKLDGILLSHVDDFVYCGSPEWHCRVMDVLMQTFKISLHARGSFKYIGLSVVQTHSEIHVDQRKYIESLEAIELSSKRMTEKDSLLSKEEKSLLRSVSGQLLWAATQTRPDASYDACVVSNYGKEPTVRNLCIANKAIKKLKSSSVKLVFPDLGKPDEMKVIVFSDATHASLPSGASQGALVVFLAGNGRVAPVMWQSKKLNRVTKSPLASETMEFAEAADAGYLISAMVGEIYGLSFLPKIECLTDSKSLTDFLKTSHTIQDTRLRVDIARIREMIKLNEIAVSWVRKENQLADPLTKSGASSVKLLEVLRSAEF